MNPKGIIFTGGPNSVYGEDSPSCTQRDIRNGYSDSGNLLRFTAYVPICWAASVKTAPVSEYGKTEVAVDTESAAV